MNIALDINNHLTTTPPLPLVDCPIQLTLMTWICLLCSMTNTSEKYERTQQGNLLLNYEFGSNYFGVMRQEKKK